YQRLNRHFFADVENIIAGPPSGLADFFNRLIQIDGGDVVCRNDRPLPAKYTGDFSPQTASCSGDEDHPVLKFLHFYSHSVIVACEQSGISPSFWAAFRGSPR